MIELDRHIEILLLTNDCVIVPDLGGFMAHYVEASYNEADATFLPPLRTLGFNPQLKLNDSLLVQSYIEAYDISYPEALRRVEAEVRELRQHLETERQYELHDIGLLHYNEEGNLEFEPCEAGILTPQLYGLSSFELPRRVAAVTRPASSTAPTPLPEEHAITIKISWLRNLVAAAAAIVAFLMIGTPVSHQNNMLQSGLLTTGSAPAVTAPSVTAEPVLPESTTVDMPTADSAEEVSAAERESVTAERSEAPVPATPSQPASPTFCLVLACQISQHNADAFVAELQTSGFNDTRVINSKSMRRVVYGSYPSERAAYDALRDLRQQNGNFKQAWVMKLKP